jgi:hypothetical protein
MARIGKRERCWERCYDGESQRATVYLLRVVNTPGESKEGGEGERRVGRRKGKGGEGSNQRGEHLARACLIDRREGGGKGR